ncbi:MAG: hypothetical protein ACI4R9_03205 [Kiritimatiellia bacterium]
MKKLVCMLAVASVVSVLGVRAGDDVDDLLDDLSGAKDSETAEATSDASAETGGSDEGADAAADADDSDSSAEGAAGDVEGLEGLRKPANPEKHFHILPFCRQLELPSAYDGTTCKAEVKTPLSNEWVPIKEGKFYPLGSLYRTQGAQTRLLIEFGPKIEVSIKGEASFGTRAQALGEKSRTISLVSGTITVTLPQNLPEGLFVVTAPGFKAINPAGVARYTYSANEKGDGDLAIVRCVTGSLTLEGRHFKVLAMKAANEIRIRTSQDLLYTGLYGSRGDCMVRLDQGRVLIRDFETGQDKIEDKVLDWKLSPQTAVRIHRALPALGERMSVTVMTFDAAGELKNRCAFAEKLVEVNSGELGPTSKKDREELAKRAAEATEVAAAATTTTEEEAADDEPAAEDEDSPASTDDDSAF